MSTFTMTPDRILDDARIKQGPKLLYLALLKAAFEQGARPDQDGPLVCIPDNRRLMIRCVCSEDSLARHFRKLEQLGLVCLAKTRGGPRAPVRLLVGFHGEDRPGGEITEREASELRKMRSFASKPQGSNSAKCGDETPQNAESNSAKCGVPPISRHSDVKREQQPRAHSGGGPKAEEHPAVAAARAASGDKPGAAAVVKVVENMARTGDDPGALAALVEKAFRKDDPPAWLAGAIRDRRKDDGGTLRPIPLQVVPRDEPRNYPSPEDVEAARRRAANAKLPPGLARKLAAVGGPR